MAGHGRHARMPACLPACMHGCATAVAIVGASEAPRQGLRHRAADDESPRVDRGDSPAARLRVHSRGQCPGS
eukprot:scaffold115_cov304-Prasinococcus_capsulatus_cf.AAC.55